jgi:integrase
MSVRKIERKGRNGKSYFVYEARYRDGSGRLHQRTFRTKGQASAWEDGKLTEMRRGEWTDPQRGRTRFADFAEEWLRTTVDLRTSTRARTEGILNSHLTPYFGERRLADIVAVDVRAFVAEQAVSGLAPATVAKHLRLLSQILGAARASRYIPDNPCAGVKPPQIQEDDVEYLEAEQLNQLADEIEPRFRAMVLLAGYRGPRWGELAGLQRARVNLEKGTVEIAEILVEVAGAFSFGPPKTTRGRRTIPLPPFLVQVLDDHIRRHASGEFVFTSPKGKLLHRSSFARRYFRPAVSAAGLNSRLTFHGLRHTAVSILAAEGAQLNELATVMGWSRSTAAAMAVRYAHLFSSRQEHLTARLEAVFRGAEAQRYKKSDGILMATSPVERASRQIHGR